MSSLSAQSARVTTLPVKVMEFSKTIFQAWKVMENSQGHGKVMENDDDVLDFFFVKMH